MSHQAHTSSETAGDSDTSMNPEDRMDLQFDLAELMESYEEMGFKTGTLRCIVVGVARGRIEPSSQLPLPSEIEALLSEYTEMGNDRPAVENTAVAYARGRTGDGQ